MNKVCLVITIMAVLAMPAHAVNSAYKVSPQIPMESWTYPALDKVVALCQVKTGLGSIRPLTRMEAARLVAEASLHAALYAVPLKAKMLLKRLREEFHEELVFLGAEPAESVKAPSKILRSVQLRYTYQDGEESRYPNTDARQFGLTYNNSGREYDENHNGEVSLLGDLLLFNQVLLSWQPVFLQREDAGSQVKFQHAVAAVAWEGVELSVGRQELWWGPGRHGSLILTNNSQPFDMIRITNPSPLQLPWIFKYLGPFRFDTFLAKFDDGDREVGDPYFGGLRFDFRPSQYLELGASRTVMFGGDGQPSLDAGDILTIIGGQNLNGDDDTSNSIAGVDATIYIPLLWGIQLYGELYGEDEANMLPSKNSFLAGLFLPQMESSGTLSLRVEYADTTGIGNGGPVFYKHGVYKSGYIYRDRIMGHHAGGDATDLSLTLGVDWSPDLLFSAGFDYEERGKSLDFQEEHVQFDVSGIWWVKPNLSLSAHYAYDHVKNWDYQDGNKDFHFGSVGVEYQF